MAPTSNLKTQIKRDGNLGSKVEGGDTGIKKSSVAEPMENYNERSIYQRLDSLECYEILKDIAEYKTMIKYVAEEINISDLGCSHGFNTISLYKTIISDMLAVRPELNFRVNLNDLPSNDFGSVFHCLNDAPTSYQFLPQFQTTSHGSKNPRVQTFVNGASFYQPLFPPKSQHLITSFWTLHWLPDCVPLQTDLFPNGSCVSEIERNQLASIAHNALTHFLNCRFQELTAQGILTFSLGSFPELTKQVNTQFQNFVQHKNLDITRFANLVLPNYWRSRTEVERALQAVKLQFKVLKHQQLKPEKVEFDFQSLRSAIYNTFLQGVVACQVFDTEKEASDFTEGFMQVLNANYPKTQGECTLIVLQKIG